MADYTYFDTPLSQEDVDLLDSLILPDFGNQVDDFNPGLDAVHRCAESAAPVRTAAAPRSGGTSQDYGDIQFDDFPLLAQGVAMEEADVTHNHAESYHDLSQMPPQDRHHHANSFAHGAGFQIAADQRAPRAPSTFAQTYGQAYGGTMADLGVPPPATPPYMPPPRPAFPQDVGVPYDFGRDVLSQDVPCRLLPRNLRSLQYDEQAAVAGPSTGGSGAPQRVPIALRPAYVPVLPPVHGQMMPQPPFPLAHQAQPTASAPDEQPDGAEQAPAKKGSGHCSLCGKFFKDVRSHESRYCKVKQKEEPKLECPHEGCPSTFTQERERKRHVDTMHEQSEQRVFKCDGPCSYQCNREDNLRRHKQSKACRRQR